MQEASISIPQTSTARSSSEAETAKGMPRSGRSTSSSIAKAGSGKSFVAFLFCALLPPSAGAGSLLRRRCNEGHLLPLSGAECHPHHADGRHHPESINRPPALLPQFGLESRPRHQFLTFGALAATSLPEVLEMSGDSCLVGNGLRLITCGFSGLLIPMQPLKRGLKALQNQQFDCGRARRISAGPLRAPNPYRDYIRFKSGAAPPPARQCRRTCCTARATPAPSFSRP